jgi:hypothetical protein
MIVYNIVCQFIAGVCMYTTIFTITDVFLPHSQIFQIVFSAAFSYKICIFFYHIPARNYIDKSA